MTPTGLNVEAARGTPRRRLPRSDNIDSPEGHRGGSDDAVEPREGHRGLINSLEQEKKDCGACKNNLRIVIRKIITRVK